MTSTTRRTFLSLLGGQLLDALVPPAAAAVSEPHTLVYITLNGGMDGLNAVVPHADPDYYVARPNLAVPPPGQGADSAIDLDGFFGLHPNLQPLKALFDAGDLAIVHATGAPYVDRSHFSATKRMQSGLATPATYYTGWLARHLETFSGFDDLPFRGITIGCAQHEALRGTRAASALRDVNGFDLSPAGQGDYTGTLQALYSPTSLLGQQTLDTIDVIATFGFYHPASYTPDNGANYPSTDLARKLKQAAQYIKSGMGTEAICINSNGWDHHQDLAGMLPAKLDELAQALTTFYQDMGPRMQKVTVMVTTEFGRRVAENASYGVDHGRGTCLFALGDRVNGGRVYAEWPGLAEYQLNRGDLEITTDFRVILSEALVKLLENAWPDQVFTDFTSNYSLNLFSQA
jgi:uncharacterized protein (DUF1501 family)